MMASDSSISLSVCNKKCRVKMRVLSVLIIHHWNRSLIPVHVAIHLLSPYNSRYSIITAIHGIIDK
jgi:hypothetical protein